MVLYQRIHYCAVSGEAGHHVKVVVDDDLSVQDVVVGVVAMIHPVGELDHEACGVSISIGAGVRFVGRDTVVGQKLRVALPIDNDASAGAFNVGGDIEPAADEVQLLIL